MLPIVAELTWLRNDRRRFFTVDNESFSLFELDRDYKLGVCEKSQPHTEDLEESELDEDGISHPPFKKLFKKDFDKTNPPRAVALSYLQDSVVALCFSNKIIFHRANADPARVPDDTMMFRKTPICVDWSPIDKHKFLCISDRAHKDFAFSVFDLEKASNLGYENIPRLLHWSVQEKLTTGAFFPEDKDLIGLLSKDFIRIVDIRGRERQAAAVVQSNDGKPFVSLHVEPHIGYRFLTYRYDPKAPDNEIHVYDRRYLKRPIYVHSEYSYSKSLIRRCIWNPHSRFNVDCLTVDANKIHEFSISSNAYDYGSVFRDSHASPDEISDIIDRSVDAYPYLHSPLSFPGVHNIRNFEWHPKYDNELALITNRSQNDLRHIQLFKLNKNSYAVMGGNNECAYVYKQFVSVTESVVQQPLQAHRIKFLERKAKKDKPRGSQLKGEILPFQYSEGMFYLDNRAIHNLEACKISNCEECLRGYLNTRVDEEERRKAEDMYFSKYWSQISSDAIANIETCKESLRDLLNGDDISVIMRQRIEYGYGYGQARDPLGSMIANCQNTIKIEPRLASSEVTFLWCWLERMNHLNAKYNLQSKYGHYYVGIDVIIENIHSVSSQYDENCDWGCSRVFTNEKRQQMLQMCLWPEFGDSDGLKRICDGIITEKSIEAYIRAVFLSLAACQGALAKEYLKKLKEGINNNRLSYKNKRVNFIQLVKDTIKQIENFNGANLEKGLYDELCEKMKEVPILLACVKFLARRLNYALIMYEIAMISEIKIEDRVMFALINMDDKLLQATLGQLHAEMLSYEPLKAFMFIGLYDCRASHNAILRYYENTNDSQTTSILYLIGRCFESVNVLRNPAHIGLRTEILAQKLARSLTDDVYKRGLNCFFDYLDILTRWNMHIERTFLYNQLFMKAEQKSRITRAQAVIACQYCHRAAYPCASDHIRNHKARGRELPDNFSNRARITTCGGCRKPLPKCVICRHHYGSIVESMALLGENGSSIDHSFVFCTHCHHGGHYLHMKEWFQDYSICPASGCDCKCSTRDGALLDDDVAQKASKVNNRKVIKKHSPYSKTVESNLGLFSQ